MIFRGVYVRERTYEDNRSLLPLFFYISTYFWNLAFYFKDSPFSLHFTFFQTCIYSTKNYSLYTVNVSLPYGKFEYTTQYETVDIYYINMYNIVSLFILKITVTFTKIRIFNVNKNIHWFKFRFEIGN